MSKRSADRQNAIMNQLISEGTVLVRELSAAHQVSEETIRQDLSRLAALGLCSRTHGGAMLAGFSEVSTEIKASEHAAEKNRIARLAVHQIKDGSHVWIGPGSTLALTGRYLPLRHELTVITNNFDLVQSARSSRHDILFLGGRVQKKSGCTAGTFAMENLSRVHIDLALIGCDGFSCEGDPTTFSYEEMEIKQYILSRAEKKILVCDASKFTRTGSFIFSSLSMFDALLTDERTAVPALVSSRLSAIISPDQQEPYAAVI